jgi:glycyl-tRNA synthetase beta chain
VLRAVRLCKCDLTTQMVQEFTELQGVVGGLYAREQGEHEAVWQAIYDHYLPVNIEDQCPRGISGAVVSLADKLDSVIAGFAAGLEPTGSSDPFALRRAGNGIIKLLIEREFAISLSETAREIIEQLQSTSSEEPQDTANQRVLASVDSFFEERLRYYLTEVRKYRYDTVRAILAAGGGVSFANAPALKEINPLDALRRAEALERIRDTNDFVALSAAARRIKNILLKSARADAWDSSPIDENLLQAGPERELYDAYFQVRQKVAERRARGDHYRVLELIAALRPAVDLFFDKILVMSEDPALRGNRLRLLLQLDRLFSVTADLSEIESVTSTLVGAPTRPD